MQSLVKHTLRLSEWCHKHQKLIKRLMGYILQFVRAKTVSRLSGGESDAYNLFQFSSSETGIVNSLTMLKGFYNRRRMIF